MESNLKTPIHLKPILQKQKDKQPRRKFSQQIVLAKDLYPEYLRHFYLQIKGEKKKQKTTSYENEQKTFMGGSVS